MVSSNDGGMISRSHLGDKRPLRRILDGRGSSGAGLFRTTKSREFLRGCRSRVDLSPVHMAAGKESLSSTIPHSSLCESPIWIWGSEQPLGLPRANERILSLVLPGDVRRAYARYLSEACHAASSLYLKERNFSLAWEWQVKGLRHSLDWQSLRHTASFLMRLVAARQVS
jgi:hypothetical protein